MSNEIPLVQRVISILWPSFLTSALATILFFTAFDPLYLLSGTALAEMSRMGAYTLGFFLFWGLTTLTSGLTCYFSQPCDENRRKAERVKPEVGTLKSMGKDEGDDRLHGAM